MLFGQTKNTSGWIDWYLAHLVEAMLHDKFANKIFLMQVKWIYDRPRDPWKGRGAKDGWILSARHNAVALAREVEVRVNFVSGVASPDEMRQVRTARAEFTLTREKDEDWIKWDVLRAHLFIPNVLQDVLGGSVGEDRHDFHFHSDMGCTPHQELKELSDFLRKASTNEG